VTSGSPVWHPFTQHALQPDAVEVVRGRGSVLETADGRQIVDAISSWWVVTHGHGHPRIVAALTAQAERLDQVIFAGFTHAPAEALARRLVAMAPPGLARVFFSDSGSTSVEVALKMALGYWRNRGEARATIAAIEHAYHGDTTAAMSAGARGLFNAPYEPMLFDVARIPFPSAGLEQAALDALEALCRARTLAALIVEPLILGAGGMRIYAAPALAEMRRITAHYGTLLVADEVMTGWGRTGTLFASSAAGIVPDILCTAKGLTGGALPLAATLATEAIFDAHYSSDRTRTFFHSSSYTANPICCAAALANVEIWESEPVIERITALSAMQSERLARLASDARVTGCRQLATIAALDVCVPDGGYLAGMGPALAAAALDAGVLLRPLGNTVYVMPPYCITAPELDRVYAAIDGALDRVLK